jgi:hypothetical protein
MAGNWIILDSGSGRPINLDYVIDVQLGADWAGATTAQTKSVFVYQAVQTNSAASGKLLPQYAAVQYDSPNEAKAAFNRIIGTLKRLGYIQDDMRVAKATIGQNNSPNPVAGDDGQAIEITGTGFKLGGEIRLVASGVNTDPMPLGVRPDSNGTVGTFILDPGIAAGTYGIEYSDPEGNFALLEDGIVIDP